jgi:hypothetical protein
MTLIHPSIRPLTRLATNTSAIVKVCYCSVCWYVEHITGAPECQKSEWGYANLFGVFYIFLIGIWLMPTKNWRLLGTTKSLYVPAPLYLLFWSWPSLALVHMEIMQLCRFGEVNCSTMKGRPVAASCAARALWANGSNYVKKPQNWTKFKDLMDGIAVNGLIIRKDCLNCS